MQLVELTKIVESVGGERTKPLAVMPTAILTITPTTDPERSLVTVSGRVVHTVARSYADTVELVNVALSKQGSDVTFAEAVESIRRSNERATQALPTAYSKAAGLHW